VTVGAALHIWTGRPATQAESVVLADTEWTGQLLRGLYVAEVPTLGLRQGFQVSGAGEVTQEISQSGPPVIVPNGSELFCLDVVAGNPAAAISVTDHQFNRIFTQTGELHERDMPGVYKVRVGFGRDITMISDEIVLLDRDHLPGAVSAPQLASPAPIQGSAATREFHEEPFKDAAGRRGPFSGPAAGLSAISLLARYWTDQADQAAILAGPAAPPHPMQGLQLIDVKGRPVADLTQDCKVQSQGEIDSVAVWEGKSHLAITFCVKPLATVGFMKRVSLRLPTGLLK
jgi:hypothetical protein